METQEFLDNFLKKEIIKKEGRKKIPIKIYQCPKCDAKDKSDGTFTNPIMFLAHIIQDCPDWAEFVTDPKIFSFMAKQDPHKLLKEYMSSVQKILAEVGGKN